MGKKNAPKPQEVRSSVHAFLEGKIDATFPGDEKGNRVAAIEADLKLKAEYDQLNQEIINDIILTTSDKLKNQLSDYHKLLVGKLDWVGPLGIIISLIAALVATDFKDTFLFIGTAWETIFIIALILSVIWLLVVIYKIFSHRNERRIDYLVDKIKRREDI